jgi:hypothetical protein
MRKENGSIFSEEDFFLKKGQKHDFGPLTLQLRDNWRMVCGIIIVKYIVFVIVSLKKSTCYSLSSISRMKN